MRYCYTRVRAAGVENTASPKLWWGSAAAGTLIPHGGSAPWCRRFGRQFDCFSKLNIPLPYDPTNVLLDIFPKKQQTLCPHKNLDIRVCSTFIYKCQNLEVTEMSFSKWKDKWTVIHQAKEYYSALKWNELSSHEKTWRNLKCIALNERSQPEKAAYSMIASVWHSGKGYWDVKRSLDAKQ